ncbi:MAG: hypothetical protein QXT45_05590 [Candidatus Bilamarchaeaceae archaeon]
MFLAFDPFTLLLIVTICLFVPGALLSLALLQGTRLNILEKVFVGFGLGFCLPQTIPFLAFFLFGIKYTYDMALATVGIFWAIALALAALKRIDRDIIEFLKGLPSVSKSKIVFHACVVFVAMLAFWIRFGSYSPVFHELDPYYYTYVSQQIITFGYNPFNDQTAWYPEVNVSHRVIPVLAYMESLWYSLYNGSNQYNNMLLAVIASLYPPIAAALSVFFLYLFLSRLVRKEYALIGAGISSFMPSFIFKLMAGEAEIQPYAFFALPFFYALYVLMLQERKKIFAVLSGIAFFALALGSATEVLATTTLILFWFACALLLFIKNSRPEEVRELIELNVIALGVGVFFGSALLKGLYSSNMIALHSLLPALFLFLALGVLYYIQLTQPDILRERKMAVATLMLAILIFLVSPLGEPIKAIGRAGFMVAQYNTPLQRTIAEQGVAGVGFSHEMGFVAANFREISAYFFSPILSFLTVSEAKESVTRVAMLCGDITGLLFLISSLISNLLNSVAVAAINIILGSSVEYGWKENSLLMFWEFAFFAAIIFFLTKKKNADAREIAPVLLLLIVIFPPFIVGIIKAKYTIYASFFLGAAIAFVLNQTEVFLEERKQSSYPCFYLILAIGISLLLMQFLFSGFTPALAILNFQTRFQDNPLALQEKFQQMCTEIRDPKVCAAAHDPLGYASLGTNYQYDSTLCVLSTLPDYTTYINPAKAPTFYQAALLRCNRVNDYWLEAMEWIRDNTENDSRTTSWWDYGHWINFYGQRNTVLRNEHASERMIGEVAFAYTEGNESDLTRFMKEHDSKYALFDVEIVLGGGGFGGKYGALNYLGCAYMNRTNVSFAPGTSECEEENIWETVYVSNNARCKISGNSNKTGVTAYKVYVSTKNGLRYSPYYPSLCSGDLSEPARVQAFCAEYGMNMPYCSPCSSRCIEQFCSIVYKLVPTYCVGEVELTNGQKITGTYYLNETYPNGDLRINKALIAYPFNVPATYHAGDLTGVTLLYTKDKFWLENGEIVDGYSDRKGHFYDSNIYKGFVLGEIEGFEKVFDNNAIKIYKINE